MFIFYNKHNMNNSTYYYTNSVYGNKNKHEVETNSLHNISNQVVYSVHDNYSNNYALCDVHFGDSYAFRRGGYVSLNFTHYMNENGEIKPVGYIDITNRIQSEPITNGYRNTLLMGKIISYELNSLENMRNAYDKTIGSEEDRYKVLLKIPFRNIDAIEYKNKLRNIDGSVRTIYSYPTYEI